MTTTRFIEDVAKHDVQDCKTKEIVLDFTFNRFTTRGLADIIRLLVDYPQVVACVGWNHFQFPELYKTVNMGYSNWVEDGRIFMGSTEFDQKLDRIAAVQMKTEGNLNELSTSVAAAFKDTMKEASMTRETSKNLANWGKNEREFYEYIVTTILKSKLEEIGYTNFEDFPDKYRIIPHFSTKTEEVRGIEWDGIFTAEKDGVDIVFFIEAKKTSRYDQMRNMPERIRRTTQFIDNAERVMQVTTGRVNQARCYLYSRLNKCKVRGVLAGDDIPPDAAQMARTQGYITVSKSADGYKLQGDL